MPRKVGTPWKVDISGKRYGAWVVLGRHAGSMWLCRCECGTEKAVSGSSLKLGTSVSCGCTAKTWCTVHRKEKSRVYGIWATMKQRCLNPKARSYENYGGAGITVAPEWMNFLGFYADMGDPPEGASIGRINNSLGYCKENCRWETNKQQIRNRTNTIFVDYQGKKVCLAELAENNGVKLKVVSARLKAGWPIDKAISIAAKTINRGV